jgi:beta-lactamase class D
LKTSPLEQLAFLEKIVNRQLPVTPHAFEMTSRITRIAVLANGWEVHGKTGSGSPPTADGAYDQARAYGWFIGWARKGSRTVVFARLVQDETPQAEPAGLGARAAFLKELPSLLASLAD